MLLREQGAIEAVMNNKSLALLGNPNLLLTTDIGPTRNIVSKIGLRVGWSTKWRDSLLIGLIEDDSNEEDSTR